MKNVQKLVLVPMERWEKIGDNIPVKQVSVTSVTQKNVSHPTNPTSQVMKAKLKVKNQKGLGKQQVMKKTQMFHFLTQEKRKKATKLFEYLTRNKIFVVNKDGELIVKGQTLQGSNVIELITHAVQDTPHKPVGINYFYQTLKKNKIPERLISNKIGRKIMNKPLFDQTSKWRPPGHLNEVKNKK